MVRKSNTILQILRLYHNQYYTLTNTDIGKNVNFNYFNKFF